jgi:hypothetical protein
MRIDRWLGAAALAAALTGAHAGPPAPRVVLVQPSGAAVPCNLLRLTIEFDRPVAGQVLRRLSLVRSDGSQVDAPFLEQELWSPDGKALTVLMHPGRVKSGLIAHDDIGAILATGEDVALLLDGRPIKRWTVAPADTVGPDAAAWTVSRARAGSRQPLVVKLDGAIDGRDAGYLAIVDAHEHRVPGRARLSDGEHAWNFVPDAPWRAGAYTLVVHGTLEDAAGNRLGSRFETPVQSPPGAPVDAVIPFTVQRARG